MIRLHQFSYGFPQKDLYHQIDFSLERGNHCAFIGTSGCGKSTLIEILMNPDAYMYTGTLEIDPLCRIGYIKQFSQQDYADHVTVLDYIAEPFTQLQAEIDSLCHQMTDTEKIEPLLEAYQQALDAFSALDGDQYESNILKKLGLANLAHHKDLPIKSLSGGEFKLVQVIKEMLHQPDVLLMDEPDAFLDFENLIALKDLINSHKGILFVITHNRYLLNHCFNKIIHLENTELQVFEGNYIAYNFALLQTKIEMQEAAQAHSEKIAQNEALLERLRYIASYNADASRGSAVRARVKIQERLEAQNIKAPFVDIQQPKITLSTPTPLTDANAITVKDLTLGFKEILMDQVDFEIGPTDKVALIGANGTGKTTLVRALLANHQNAALHPDLKFAYLSQQQGEVLNLDHTILEAFLATDFDTPSQAKRHLAAYGFKGEILDQRISKLSGGEKNLLQLAKLAACDANFLILDEPTSHLDTYAQVALEDAIKAYNGGLLIISHDYFTIANCVDYVLLLEGKTIRKMSLKKFRKMIFKNHFNRDYLALDEKKKAVELDVALALKATDFEKAKKIAASLEVLIQSIQ